MSEPLSGYYSLEKFINDLKRASNTQEAKENVKIFFLFSEIEKNIKNIKNKKNNYNNISKEVNTFTLTEEDKKIKNKIIIQLIKKTIK